MSTTENTRYREVAEYETTVEAARKAAGLVTPADCLAYEVDQYEAAYKEQIYSEQLYFDEDDEDIKQKLPKLLSKEHPDYPQRLAERKAEAERELSKIYALHGQELADQWATEHRKARDKRLLLACLLKESAHRLLDGYAGYLTLVGLGRLLPGTVLPGFLFRRLITSEKKPASWIRRMKERSTEARAYYGINCNTGSYADLDRGLIAAGAGAAELAHFKQLLAEFYEAEQAPAVPQPEPTTSATAGPVVVRIAGAAPVEFGLYLKDEYCSKLLPFLKAEYTGKKSKSFACMLLALHDLEALKDSPHGNKTELHKSLTAFFGDADSRQALSSNLKNLEYAKGNEHLQIQAHRQRILTFMKRK